MKKINENSKKKLLTRTEVSTKRMTDEISASSSGGSPLSIFPIKSALILMEL